MEKFNKNRPYELQIIRLFRGEKIIRCLFDCGGTLYRYYGRNNAIECIKCKMTRRLSHEELENYCWEIPEEFNNSQPFSDLKK